MELFKHFKNAIFSVVPFYIVLLLLYCVFAKVNGSALLSLSIATILMIVGMTIFFPGLKAALEDGLPLLTDNLITKHKKPFLFISIFLLGFASTFSEPSVKVFVLQFAETVKNVSENSLILVVSLSCSLFLLLAVFRAVLHLSMRLTFLGMYFVYFMLTLFLPEAKVGVAMDSGAAATGLITVPFITVLGTSFIERLQGAKTEDKFGFSGIASIGVLIFVALFLFFTPLSSSEEVVSSLELGVVKQYLNSFLSVLKSIVPFLIIYIIQEVVVLKHKGYMLRSRLFGFTFMLLGVMLIFASATVSYVPFVQTVAESVFYKGKIFSIIVGMAFGFLSAFLEPSVLVLAKEIEKELNGRVSHMLIVLSIGIGLALTMGVFVTKIYYPFNVKWFFIILYALILGLMFFTDDLFVGISFDAGSAGAGVMSGVVLLPFVLSCASLSSTADALSSFGVVGGVVTFPIIICEILGIIYSYKVKGKNEVKK